jgi:hypothetical protein
MGKDCNVIRNLQKLECYVRSAVSRLRNYSGMPTLTTSAGWSDLLLAKVTARRARVRTAKPDQVLTDMPLQQSVHLISLVYSCARP